MLTLNLVVLLICPQLTLFLQKLSWLAFSSTLWEARSSTSKHNKQTTAKATYSTRFQTLNFEMHAFQIKLGAYLIQTMSAIRQFSFTAD